VDKKAPRPAFSWSVSRGNSTERGARLGAWGHVIGRKIYCFDFPAGQYFDVNGVVARDLASGFPTRDVRVVDPQQAREFVGVAREGYGSV
jgi:hypothetical protein